jgi:Prolyl oligopeptidase, N-terminal beta-propeller domain.
MRKVYFFAILLCLNFGNIFSQKNFNPPATKQIPVVDSLFGYIITDPYRWLEDKANPRSQRMVGEAGRICKAVDCFEHQTQSKV